MSVTDAVQQNGETVETPFFPVKSSLNLSPYDVISSDSWRRKSVPAGLPGLVKVPCVIVTVGLPARGKTYISKKLCRYLNWIGIHTKVFNLGNYRRILFPEYAGNEIFSPDNAESKDIRDKCADMAMSDLYNYLISREGEVAIFDATNTTRERRHFILDRCVGEWSFRVFFVESICESKNIIEKNIQDVKVNSPDYRNMDREMARDDFLKRISHYEVQYEPLDDEYDKELSFIKVFDAGKSFYVSNVIGHVQSRAVYFLMNMHLLRRSIYLARHGESVYNMMGRIGGDCPLSERGLQFGERLKEYFATDKTPHDLRVWSSQKLRAIQTAQYLVGTAAYIEYWKALDEIDAGICEGLTYEEIAERYPEQFAARDQNKVHYRYPSGESYDDLVARLEPVIMELEKQENVLVISHQAVLRCLLAYFLDKPRDELPYLKVPLHSVIKLTPVAYGCDMEVVPFDVLAVDTHRDKPTALDKSRSVQEALSTLSDTHVHVSIAAPNMNFPRRKKISASKMVYPRSACNSRE